MSVMVRLEATLRSVLMWSSPRISARTTFILTEVYSGFLQPLQKIAGWGLHDALLLPSISFPVQYDSDVILPPDVM
jgi:hypothetical protein